MLQKLISAYIQWHLYLSNIPKNDRYTLAVRIDALFVDILELLLLASYEPKKNKKPFVQKASRKTTLLKALLRVAWEVKALDSKKYAHLSRHVDEVGKLTGAWLKKLP